MEEKQIKAKYKPKNRKDLSNKLEMFDSDVVFIWDYAFKIDGIKRYTTNNIRFPSTGPIFETDLVEIE